VSHVRVSGGLGGAGRRVLLLGLENPQVYAAGGALWVAQQVTPPGAPVLSELMRVGPASGDVWAIRRLGSAFDQALLADRTLWVTTTRGRRSWLWRLDPGSLRVRSRNILPSSGTNDGIIGTLARAGGWLWVGTSDRIDRVSPSNGRVTAEVVVPGAEGVDVEADTSGRVLLDSEGQELAYVQRRDPQTGALIASSAAFNGVTKPYIGGVADGGAWVNEATGMMGYIARLSLVTLQPTPFTGAQPQPGQPGPPRIEGTNGVAARLIAGVLWVTQLAGGVQRNYCGAPSTGRALVALPLGDDGELLTADDGSIYYTPDASNPAGAGLARASVDPRCDISSRPSHQAHTAMSASTPSVSGGSLTAGPFCKVSQLRLYAGTKVSEMTEQDTRLLILHNISTRGCDLHGYPSITLLDSRGAVLGFRYRRRGDQELTGAAPARVAVPVNHRAYFALNKTACVARAKALAGKLVVTVPHARGKLTLKLALYPLLDYCAAPDPGHTIDVTPIEQTPDAVFSAPLG